MVKKVDIVEGDRKSQIIGIPDLLGVSRGYFTCFDLELCNFTPRESADTIIALIAFDRRTD